MKMNKYLSSSAIHFVFIGFLVVATLVVPGGAGPGSKAVALAADEGAGGSAAVAEADGGDLQAEDEKDPFAVEQQVVSDPYESLNRMTHKFNDKFYFWFLKPVATVYATIIPEGLRVCFRNVFKNADYPVRLVNCTLQGKFKGAAVETGRFVINSTLGMGGFFEIASRDFDLHPYDEDTGQTLGFYGVPAGPYIHVPVLGPNSTRDLVGTAADVFMNPAHYFIPDMWVSAGIKGGRITNNASLRLGEYEDFKAAAVDPYVSMRDAFYQYRTEEIKK